MRAARAIPLGLFAAVVSAACAFRPEPGDAPYRPARADYTSFRAAHDELLEPNYLPFMAHRVAGKEARGDVLVFCPPRYGAYYLQRGRILHLERRVVNGRPALETLLETDGGRTLERVTLIESGAGRVVAVTADCRAEHYDVYAPWFEATLATLQIWE